MIFLSSCVLIYSLLLTPSIDSKWISPTWKKMIPVRGYVQLNNRVFNLSEPIQVPQIAQKLVSKFSQHLSVAPVQSLTSQPAQSPPVEPAQAPTVIPAQAPSVEPAQAPTVEPAQALAATPLAEPQEPASESSSELDQSPIVELSSPSTTSTSTTTTTTTTTSAPTTPSTTTTTSTVAPRVVPVAPVKTYVAPSKTHSVVQSEVVKVEAVKSPAKSRTVSKTSQPKAATKTTNYSTKQVVQSPSRFVSPAKTARVIQQSHF